MIPPRSNSGSGSFPTTPWSRLFALREASHPVEAREMLDGICAIYWRPINIFVRASGYDYDDAQDLTQRFVLHLIERERFARADPARGRFRSYVLGALKYFLAHVRQEERAQKRGGGAAVIPLDEAIIGTIGNATARPGVSPHSHPADRQWALAIHRRISDRIAREYIVAGKAEVPPARACGSEPGSARHPHTPSSLEKRETWQKTLRFRQNRRAIDANRPATDIFLTFPRPLRNPNGIYRATKGTDGSAIEANHPAIDANRATTDINRSATGMNGLATDPNRRATDTNRLTTGTDLRATGMNRRVMYIFQFTKDICRPAIHIYRQTIHANRQTILANQRAADQSRVTLDRCHLPEATPWREKQRRSEKLRAGEFWERTACGSAFKKKKKKFLPTRRHFGFNYAS